MFFFFLLVCEGGEVVDASAALLVQASPQQADMLQVAVGESPPATPKEITLPCPQDSAEHWRTALVLLGSSSSALAWPRQGWLGLLHGREASWARF
jgi:hypothetical protein